MHCIGPKVTLFCDLWPYLLSISYGILSCARRIGTVHLYAIHAIRYTFGLFRYIALSFLSFPFRKCGARPATMPMPCFVSFRLLSLDNCASGGNCARRRGDTMLARASCIDGIAHPVKRDDQCDSLSRINGEGNSVIDRFDIIDGGDLRDAAQDDGRGAGGESHCTFLSCSRVRRTMQLYTMICHCQAFRG